MVSWNNRLKKNDKKGALGMVNVNTNANADFVKVFVKNNPEAGAPY